jgi:hypothetical protein
MLSRNQRNQNDIHHTLPPLWKKTILNTGQHGSRAIFLGHISFFSRKWFWICPYGFSYFYSKILQMFPKVLFIRRQCFAFIFTLSLDVIIYLTSLFLPISSKHIYSRTLWFFFGQHVNTVVYYTGLAVTGSISLESALCMFPVSLPLTLSFQSLKVRKLSCSGSSSNQYKNKAKYVIACIFSNSPNFLWS